MNTPQRLQFCPGLVESHSWAPEKGPEALNYSYSIPLHLQVTLNKKGVCQTCLDPEKVYNINFLALPSHHLHMETRQNPKTCFEK